jgi:hypothetical protein
MENFKEFLACITVKTTVIAMAVRILYIYLVNNILLSAQEIAVALVSVGLVGYIMSSQIDPTDVTSNFFIGFIAYFAYVGARLFLKLIDTFPPIKETATSALIYASITVVVLWIYKRY